MNLSSDRKRGHLVYGRANWTGFVFCALLAIGGIAFAITSLRDFGASMTGGEEANDEIRARYDDFLRVASEAVRIDAGAVPDPSLEGRLVIVSGNLSAEGAATDPDFGIVAEHAVLLRRDVAVLQNVTSHTATRERDPAGYQPWLGDSGFDRNPSRFRTRNSVTTSLSWKPAYAVHQKDRRVDDARFPASGIRIGVLPISDSLAQRLQATNVLDISPDVVERITSPLRDEIRVGNGTLFIGSGDREGHWRMDYVYYPKGETTVLATWHEGRLDVHPDRVTGRTIALSAPGRHEVARLNPHSLEGLTVVESQWRKFLGELSNDPWRFKDYREGRRVLIGLAVFVLFLPLAWYNWPLRGRNGAARLS